MLMVYKYTYLLRIIIIKSNNYYNYLKGTLIVYEKNSESSSFKWLFDFTTILNRLKKCHEDGIYIYIFVLQYFKIYYQKIFIILY